MLESLTNIVKSFHSLILQLIQRNLVTKLLLHLFREVEKQEEWCKRVIDEEFSPFQRMKYEYIPSLHNSSKCER